jgi:hypothetical protein
MVSEPIQFYDVGGVLCGCWIAMAKGKLEAGDEVDLRAMVGRIWPNGADHDLHQERDSRRAPDVAR